MTSEKLNYIFKFLLKIELFDKDIKFELLNLKLIKINDTQKKIINIQLKKTPQNDLLLIILQ